MAAMRGPAGIGSELDEALVRAGRYLRRGVVSADVRTLQKSGGREADSFYRDRWSYDKVVRSAHGVNCTGSCSWKVYVKDGIITWVAQRTDYPSYPSAGPGRPDYARRGCPRGAAFSWYTYSPTRVRYPHARGVLLELFREAKGRHDGDPVEAWAEISGNSGLAARYKSARFHALIGAPMLSSYDWYADLPVASPQVFGDQTDVPESGDWWDASYLVLWGLQRGKSQRAADHDSGKDGLDYGHRRCGRPGTIPEPDSHGYQGSPPWLLRIRDGHRHHLDRRVPAGTVLAIEGAARCRVDRARRAQHCAGGPAGRLPLQRGG
jgi:nitrate reductase alpha subunit